MNGSPLRGMSFLMMYSRKQSSQPVLITNAGQKEKWRLVTGIQK